MGYLHIENLYKNKKILMFKECYAMEKIHGTSAHIKWNATTKELRFFSGGAKHDQFIALFDVQSIQAKFAEKYDTSDVTIYGEAYGGKLQGMSETYGKELKFIVFDVQIREHWLEVHNADAVATYFGLEFVDYVKVPTDLEILDAEMNKQSIQAIRNGCGEGKIREGIVLRPLEELIQKNGDRFIAKHVSPKFRETRTPRIVTDEQVQVLEDAKVISEEWVTERRLQHVLDKLPQGINMGSTKLVIDAMVEDVYREAKGEIVENDAVTKSIGRRTAIMFKEKLTKELYSNDK